MKAAQISKYGESSVEINDVGRPEPGEGEILVEVHAAGVNPFDWKIRDGMYEKMMPLKLPATLGGDFSGLVAAVGANVSGFKKGDGVFGSANVLSGGSGAFAEFAIAKTKNAALKPKKAGHTEAGAMPLTGASALQGLVDHMKLGRGQKVLIHGGAGGIGTAAIQIAKDIGAYVAATAGEKDLEFVKSLGADEAIDYRGQRFEKLLEGFDAVFDTVGGETYAKSFMVLKKGGVIVSMLEQPRQELMEQYGVSAIAQGTHVTGERLAKLASLIDRGVVRAHIDKAFPLAKAAEALDYQKKGHPRGKVVLEMK
ncbi:MAG TPA: NADP-dependent oxidoreductase [Candidatus Bilamarchaeum sp.]|nr:NADP-dependent oxidoreductase [Candidatus Bilamarchaeum sp.]